jgi:hypothetical protein
MRNRDYWRDKLTAEPRRPRRRLLPGLRGLRSSAVDSSTSQVAPGGASSRKAQVGGGLFLTLLALVVALPLDALSDSAGSGSSTITASREPRLFPDYSDIVLPPNIAPLNFRVEEPGTRYRAEFRATHGRPITVTGRSPSIRIPQKAWEGLLRDNAGEPLYVDVAVENGASEWCRFRTITNQVAREPIDDHLAYRLLKPLYNAFVTLGIYQRDLRNFAQRPVLENRKFDGDCLNCHTFLNRSPSTLALNIRGSNKLNPMVLVRSNIAARVDKTMGYLSWHPSGRLIAFSANKLSFFSHTRGETRDVFDAKSDLGIYRVDSNTVVFPPPISLPDWNETWPGWSPDGVYLYFSRAAPLPIEKYRQVRYDLVRVKYDLERDQWGEPEVIVSSAQTGLSACQPRPSPDGRFLLFCLCKWGNFPVYQASSDLYVMELSTLQYRRLEINSEESESWHSWSSNSRWIVFSSKRLDGLFARPHFSYVDEQGKFHKPFLLPQSDPDFYDSFLKTFNVPELVNGAITVPEEELARAILKPRQILTPKEIGERRASTQSATQGNEGENQYRAAPK